MDQWPHHQRRYRFQRDVIKIRAAHGDAGIAPLVAASKAVISTASETL
jgi:hypothetical protein